MIETYGQQNLIDQVKLAFKNKFSFTKSMKLSQNKHGFEIYKTRPKYFNLVLASILFLAILSTPVKYLSAIKPISHKIGNLLLWGLK